MSEYAPGTPSWVDLATTDVDAAKTFDNKVFGWTYDGVPGGAGYETATLGQGPLAGVMAQPEMMREMGAPPAWTTYVTVSDVEGAAAEAKSGGGNVLMEPMDVMSAGRMSIVQDPTGGVLGLWQGRDAGGAAVVNEPGAFTWADLVTSNVSQASDFYQGVLGWGTIETTDPMGNPSRMFTVGEAPVASARSLDGVPTHWAVYFAVANADASAKAVSDAGGTVMMEAFDTPPGRMFPATDPTGAAFNAIQLNPDFDPTA